MSEGKVDTVEDLLLDIIDRTDKILNISGEVINTEIEEIDQTQKEELLNLMCERTKNIIEAETQTSFQQETPSTSEAEQPTETFGEIAQLTTPSFGPSINANTIWEISNPIYLTNVIYQGIGITAEGIYLSKGFYKIKYTFSNVKTASGLALFEANTKKFISLIAYQSYYGSEGEKVIRFQGEEYYNINSNVIIAITNGVGEYRPEEFRGIISVTILKQRSSPN